MSTGLDLLVQLGHDGIATKCYVIATCTILFYDYFLTLADEIQYAWCRKKSWVFLLFLVNRYLPMSYQFWILSISFTQDFNTKVCERTAWYHVFVFVFCSLVAHMVLTLRIYAVTLKNVPIATVFTFITISQFTFGIYILAQAANEGAERLPPIPLDAYRQCVFVPHRTLEIAYTGISLSFDCLAFLVIIFLAMKTKAQGIELPVISRIIAEGAILYFLVIFTSHFVFEMTLTLGRETIRLLPGPGLLVYLPVMISRLMLSLKKAADSQQGLWSLTEPPTNVIKFKNAKLLRSQVDTHRREDGIPLDTYSEA